MTMTIADPMARTIRMEGVSSRSRHPWELKRKFWFKLVAAAMTARITRTMAISREVTTFLTNRWAFRI